LGVPEYQENRQEVRDKREREGKGKSSPESRVQSPESRAKSKAKGRQEKIRGKGKSPSVPLFQRGKKGLPAQRFGEISSAEGSVEWPEGAPSLLPTVS